MKTIKFALVWFVLALLVLSVDGNSYSSYFNLPKINPNFTKNEISLDTGARCLDGSQYIVYTSEGTLKDKIILYMEGGGACIGFTLE